MKVTINQKNLKKALSLVERMVSRNNTLPILSNIVLKTENGRLKVSSTNLEIGINYLIGAKIEEVGDIAVPARIFTDFISNIDEDIITLTTKNNSLFVNSKRYKTQILGFDTKEYPIIPKLKEGGICTISTKQLHLAFTQIIDSISLSESRLELAGCYVQFTPKELICAATDSFRLVERIVNVTCTRSSSIILPRNTVSEIIRVSGEIEGDITIHISENQVAFVSDDCEVVSRLIDGKYPDYRRVIPEKFISKTLITKSDLEKNTRLAGLFSSSISDIKIVCEDKSLQILAKNADRGEASIQIDALLKNGPYEIAINYHYLLDGLKIIPTEKVVIEFTGIGSPLILKPADDTLGLTYLIMPLRS